jgi:hypothetical protein
MRAAAAFAGPIGSARCARHRERSHDVFVAPRVTGTARSAIHGERSHAERITTDVTGYALQEQPAGRPAGCGFARRQASRTRVQVAPPAGVANQ